MARKASTQPTTPGSTMANPWPGGQPQGQTIARTGSGSMPANPKLPRSGGGVLPPGPGKDPGLGR
jgi:hypothetical protein